MSLTSTYKIPQNKNKTNCLRPRHCKHKLKTEIINKICVVYKRHILNCSFLACVCVCVRQSVCLPSFGSLFSFSFHFNREFGIQENMVRLFVQQFWRTCRERQRKKQDCCRFFGLEKLFWFFPTLFCSDVFFLFVWFAASFVWLFFFCGFCCYCHIFVYGWCMRVFFFWFAPFLVRTSSK